MYYHFIYTSGSNPYIAKTETERDRIIEKHETAGEIITELNTGYYLIDDRKIYDLDKIRHESMHIFIDTLRNEVAENPSYFNKMAHANDVSINEAINGAELAAAALMASRLTVEELLKIAKAKKEMLIHKKALTEEDALVLSIDVLGLAIDIINGFDIEAIFKIIEQ